ncbi:STIP1 y and U box-containing protein 1 [Podila humilis]|nr:STIP1 y and U box-containing protein 1 [Podila humilis]
MASTLTADEHKLRGNEHFKHREYEDAIQEYSKAIMGKAQLELGQPSEALSILKKAYDLSLAQRSNFTKDIISILSEAKKQKWIEDERTRISHFSENYAYMASLIQQDLERQKQQLQAGDSYDEQLGYLLSDRNNRLQQLELMLTRASIPEVNARSYIEHKERLEKSSGIPAPAPVVVVNGVTKESPPPALPSATPMDSTYATSHPASSPLASPSSSPSLTTTTKPMVYTPREIPEYLLDKITYEFMHDPVISTKSGVTYERNTLLEHFSRGRMFDPVSQTPMTEKDMIPNRALKEACDDFLSKNGWAVDY